MTTPSPSPTPLPALAMLAALVFVVGAIGAVFVFERDPGLFRSRGSMAVSHTASGSQADPAADPPQDRMDRDGQFLWRLSTQGLQLRRSNDAAINDARLSVRATRAARVNRRSFRTFFKGRRA